MGRIRATDNEVLLKLPAKYGIVYQVEIPPSQTDHLVNSKTYYHCAACNTKLSEPSSDGLCTNCRAAIEHPPRPQDTNRADDQPTIVHDRPSKDVSQNTRRSVGDYELIEEIARGGMGVVYKARQRSLDRTVALKMILSGNLASQEDRERFEREAQAAAKLDHPGIVPIYEVGHEKTDSGQQHYFSMALVEGESLSERISRHSMSSKQAAAMMLQISAAVQYSH